MCLSAWRDSISRQKCRPEIPQDLQVPHGGQGLQARICFQYGRGWLVLEENTFQNVHDKNEAVGLAFKAQKDREVLPECSNTDGFMMKPALIYKPTNRGEESKLKNS